MRIVIFGGSFNPVHNEHVKILKAAKSALIPDEVIVMPSNITPAKNGKLTVSAEDRLNMCRLAFCEGDVSISDYEIKAGGVSYTYLTCRAFRERYPDAEIYFLMGADMLENFCLWKRPEEILRYVKIAVCARENTTGLKQAVKSFEKHFGFGVKRIDYTGGDISSTAIRTLAALGERVDGYVPKNVSDYIEEHSLYKMPEAETVKSYLTEKRWKHTVRVAVTAAKNCSRAGVNEYNAVKAALLHDCAKYMTCDSPELAGFECPQKVPPPVVHQFAGAYLAENKFGVTDVDIINAIKYHASGRADMSPLEKLIYLSDMLEESRDFDGVEELRAKFEVDIDEAMFSALKHQLGYLKSTGGEVYPLTYSAYEYLKENRK